MKEASGSQKQKKSTMLGTVNEWRRLCKSSPFQPQKMIQLLTCRPGEPPLQWRQSGLAHWRRLTLKPICDQLSHNAKCRWTWTRSQCVGRTGAFLVHLHHFSLSKCFLSSILPSMTTSPSIPLLSIVVQCGVWADVGVYARSMLEKLMLAFLVFQGVTAVFEQEHRKCQLHLCVSSF